MRNKRIALFEDFKEQYEEENEVLESIYEEWKNSLDFDLLEYLLSEDEDEDEDDREEEDDDEDEEEYTSGEKAALSRDFQVMTKEQMAAIYLRALGDSEEDRGKYIVMIPDMDKFGSYDGSDRSFSVKNAAFADAIGLESVQTLTKTAKKFFNLITGKGETKSESLYPKIVNAFNEFSTMRPRDIALYAEGAMQDSSYTKNRDAVSAKYDSAKIAKDKRIAAKKKLGLSVFSLVKSLRNNPLFSDPKKAQRAAIMRISRDSELDPGKVERAYLEYLGSVNNSSYYKK